MKELVSKGLKDDPRSGHLISSGRSFQMLGALTATAQCPLVFNLAWPAARGSQVTLGYVPISPLPSSPSLCLTSGPPPTLYLSPSLPQTSNNNAAVVPMAWKMDVKRADGNKENSRRRSRI